MKQNEDILLHSKITKHSNLMVPFSDHVHAFDYPKQNSQLLNTTTTLKYRDRFRADLNAVDIPSSGRPKDDAAYVDYATLAGDDNVVYDGEFRILRADIEAPYTYIAVSTDYKHIVVGKMTEEGDINHDIYPVSMIQMTEYIGLVCINMYVASIDLYDAVVLSADQGEPCNAVLVELVPDKEKATMYYRFIRGDECFSVVKGYVDHNYANQEINNLSDLRKYSINRTMDEIADLRKYLLEDVIPYDPSMKEDEEVVQPPVPPFVEVAPPTHEEIVNYFSNVENKENLL